MNVYSAEDKMFWCTGHMLAETRMPHFSTHYLSLCAHKVVCLSSVGYLIQFGAGFIQLLVVDGVLQGSSHLVPLLILSQLLFLILQGVETLLNVLQQLIDLLSLPLWGTQTHTGLFLKITNNCTLNFFDWNCLNGYNFRTKAASRQILTQQVINNGMWDDDVQKWLPVSFMSEMLSSLRSSYTRVPATSLSSFRRCESGAVAIWLICINIRIIAHEMQSISCRPLWGNDPSIVLKSPCGESDIKLPRWKKLLRQDFTYIRNSFYSLAWIHHNTVKWTIMLSTSVSAPTPFLPFPVWRCSTGCCGRSQRSPEGSWRHSYCNNHHQTNDYVDSQRRYFLGLKSKPTHRETYVTIFLSKKYWSFFAPMTRRRETSSLSIWGRENDHQWRGESYSSRIRQKSLDL